MTDSLDIELSSIFTLTQDTESHSGISNCDFSMETLASVDPVTFFSHCCCPYLCLQHYALIVREVTPILLRNMRSRRYERF